jgi:hypothetical protein
MNNHNSQLKLHTDSNASDIGALRRETTKLLRAKFKILRPKYRKLFGIGHMFIQTFFLRMNDTITPHTIDLSFWNILYTTLTERMTGEGRMREEMA